MARLKLLQITAVLAMLSAFVQAHEEQMINSRKLDEGAPELENKCGSCPCDNPCNPTPSPPPPSPPPPPKQPPPSNYCPPPPAAQNPPPAAQNTPSPPYVYINGPPGNIYPVRPYYSGHSGPSFSTGIIPFLISTVLWLLISF